MLCNWLNILDSPALDAGPECRKIARHIIEFGIRNPHLDAPEILDIKAWQDEIARKPFNLKQASGISECHP